MLSTIQPKVQGVAAVLVAPKPFTFLKLKSPTAGGGARRALAALGPNNAKLNMSMAKSQLAMDQEVFSKRWNFNPIKEVPLAPGRYQWTPLSAQSDQSRVEEVKDITKPHSENVQDSVKSKASDLHQSIQDEEAKCTVPTLINDQENSENEVDTEIKSELQVLIPNTEAVAVPMRNVTSSSQNCITDFFKQQKRKSGYLNDVFIPCPNTPPKKKARAIH